MAEQDDDKARPEVAKVEPDIASYATEATAARAFASLVAPMPEPVSNPPNLPEVSKQKAGALTPEAIRRIADRAEAASKRK